MNRPVLRREIDMLVPESYEFDVRSTWHTILDQYFSTSSGYMVRDEAANEFGVADITLYEHRRVPGTQQWKRHVFLIIQCKRVKYERRASKWQEAHDQLSGYLAAIHGARPPQERDPVYGAIAVGKEIQFYQYNDPSQTVRVWRPANNGHYRIPELAHHVERALVAIRQNH